MGRRQTRSKGAIDTFLSIGATFDWISPLFVIGEMLSHHDGQSFVVNVHDGANRWSLQRMFKRERIETWGYCLEPHSGNLSFHGHKGDTKRIERILGRAGL